MRLLIQHDATGWAQNLHSEGLRKYAPPGIEVTTQLLSVPVPRDTECVYTINAASCRKMSGKRVATCIASHAWLYQTNDPSNWRTRGVNPRRNSKVGQFHLTQADAVVCRNTALERWASQFTDKAKYIPAGIDHELWHPGGRKVNTGKLRVGWCGQLNQHREGHFKGYYEAWLPLCELVGHKYEMIENTNTAETARSWAGLAGWMRTLDVFVTTATSEGTPNPPIQAAACGAALISTNVGQLADWQSLRELSMIVPSYGNEEEAGVTIKLIEQRLSWLEELQTRRTVVETLLSSIEQDYSYRVLAPKTLEFVCGS